MNSLFLYARILLSLLILLYGVSVGLYTIYGISKSYTEYFCTQRRSGPIVYSQSTVYLNYLNIIGKTKESTIMESAELVYSPLKEDFILKIRKNVAGHDGVHLEFDRWSKEFHEGLTMEGFDIKINHKFVIDSGSEDLFTFRYKQGEEHFELFCSPSMYGKGENPCATLSLKSREIKPNELCLDWGNEIITVTNKTLVCDFHKRLETCDIEKSTQDNFFRVYLCLITSIGCLGLLSMVDFKRMLILRTYFSFVNFIKSFSLGDKPFCNPVTGEAEFLKEGDEVYILTMEPSNNDDSDLCLTHFNDIEGNYSLVEQGLIKATKSGRKFIKMSKTQTENLSVYFAHATINPRCCAVKDWKHYMKTSEVLENVAQGFSLKKVKMPKDEHILDIDALSFDVINKMYKLKKDTIVRLLEHNRLFFKNINLKALMCCLNNKAFHNNRPKDVKNSSWKWYTSDVARFLGINEGIKIKTQGEWKKSYALISAEVNPDIKITKAEGFLNIRVQEDDLKKKVCVAACQVVYDDVMGKLPELKKFSTEIDGVRFGLEAGEDGYTVKKLGADDFVQIKEDDFNHPPFISKLKEAKQVFTEGKKSYRDALKSLDKCVQDFYTPELARVYSTKPLPTVKKTLTKDETDILNKMLTLTEEELDKGTQLPIFKGVSKRKFAKLKEIFDNSGNTRKFGGTVSVKQKKHNMDQHIISFFKKVQTAKEGYVKLCNFYEVLNDIDMVEVPKIEDKKISVHEISQSFVKKLPRVVLKKNRKGVKANKRVIKKNKKEGGVNYRMKYIRAAPYLTHENMQKYYHKELTLDDKTHESAVKSCLLKLYAKNLKKSIDINKMKFDLIENRKKSLVATANVFLVEMQLNTKKDFLASVMPGIEF